MNPRPQKMKAVLFYGPKDLRTEMVDIPKPGTGEVLLKMGTALTCGTDFKAYRQGHPILLNNRIPSPFGHEIAGSIFELGDGVSQFYLGQRVVAANSAPCDGCYYCQLGYPNLCEHLFLLNGAYAQYLLIPKQIVKHNMYRIPDEIPFKVAAMTEPLACVVRAVDQMNLTKGQTLAILGCGLMGLFFIQIAKRMGAQVIAIGRSHAKLEYAKSLGADHVLSVLDHENPMEKALDLTPGKRGFDCVVEAIGQPETWKQAITLARKGGSVCLYGGCAKGSSFALDTHRVHYQELKVFGVFHHTPKHFAKALDYLCKGIIEADIFVRNEVSLDELPHHFAREVDRPFAKVAVLP